MSHRHRHDRYGVWQWLPDKMARGWHVLELPDFTVKLLGRARGSYWPRYEGPFWVSLISRGGAEVSLPELRLFYTSVASAKGAAVDIARQRLYYNMEKVWAAAVDRETEGLEDR